MTEYIETIVLENIISAIANQTVSELAIAIEKFPIFKQIRDGDNELPEIPFPFRHLISSDHTWKSIKSAMKQALNSKSGIQNWVLI